MSLGEMHKRVARANAHSATKICPMRYSEMKVVEKNLKYLASVKNAKTKCLIR